MNPVWIATSIATITYLLMLSPEKVLALNAGWGSDLTTSSQSVSIPSTDVLTGTQSVIPTYVPNLSAPTFQSAEFSNRQTGYNPASGYVNSQSPRTIAPSSYTSQSISPYQTDIPHPFVPSLGSYVATPRVGGQTPVRSPSQVQYLQDQLRSYQVAPDRGYIAAPAVTISNPSAYGADGNRLFAGASFQARTRYAGSGIFGRLFNPGNAGVPDGSAGIGIGLGDADDSVGLQISYTAASFGGSRPPGSGGINAKLHARFPEGWAVAVGGDGIVNFGRLPEGSPTEFNDFENTYYGVISKSFRLQDSINDPFSRIVLTAGAGSGRFRSLGQVNRRAFGIGAFGSVAVQALPNVNLITEWTGQDLSAGMSIVPFRNIPLVITPAVRDLAGRGVGGPRFVIGLGGSLGDAVSILDWLL